jgi:hypothetical protein
MVVKDGPPFKTELNLMIREFSSPYDERFQELVDSSQVHLDMVKLQQIIPQNLCTLLKRRKLYEAYRPFFIITYLLLGMIVTAVLLVTVQNPYWMFFGIAPLVPGVLTNFFVEMTFQRKISPLISVFMKEVLAHLKSRRQEIYDEHKIFIYAYYKGSTNMGRANATLMFGISKKKDPKIQQKKTITKAIFKKNAYHRIVDRIRLRFPAFFRVFGSKLKQNGWYVGEDGRNYEKVVPVLSELIEKTEEKPMQVVTISAELNQQYNSNTEPTKLVSEPIVVWTPEISSQT